MCEVNFKQGKLWKGTLRNKCLSCHLILSMLGDALLVIYYYRIRLIACRLNRYEWIDDRGIEIVGIEKSDDDGTEDSNLSTCRVSKRFKKKMDSVQSGG